MCGSVFRLFLDVVGVIDDRFGTGLDWRSGKGWFVFDLLFVECAVDCAAVSTAPFSLILGIHPGKNHACALISTDSCRMGWRCYRKAKNG
jgi:hypothetical protein